MKLTAELDILEVDGKDVAAGVMLQMIADSEDEDALSLVFVDYAGKGLTIKLDRNELLEAVARLVGVSFGESIPKQEAN